MATIFDYLNWRGDISFNEDPFNEVDNLILAELTYTQFDGLTGEGGDPVTIEEVREGFFSTHDRTEIKIDDNPIVRAPLLMDGMVSGRRFAGTELSFYVNMIDSEKDEYMIDVWNCIIDAVAYICRKIYEEQGADYFPEPIELVDEDTYSRLLAGYEKCMKQ